MAMSLATEGEEARETEDEGELQQALAMSLDDAMTASEANNHQCSKGGE